MKVSIDEVKVGDLLEDDVFNQYGLHVLSKETILCESDIEKLFMHRIDYVDIGPRTHHRLEPDIASGIEDSALLLQQHIEERVQPKFEAAVEGIHQLFEQALNEGTVSPEVLDDTFVPLVHTLQQERDLLSLLITLESQDDYTYMHSVQVGMLSYYLSKWLGNADDAAIHSAKAGFLHDIGKSQIPKEILSKPAKLSESEYELIKRHTVLGHTILTRSATDSNLAIVALQHHERMNGTGYPLGLQGSEIHPMSRICSVADVYSAMICNRVYQSKRDLLIVLKELHRLSFLELEPKATHTFIRHMLPSFTGKTAVLKNGERGKIVMMNPTDYFRPLMQIGNRFVDLSTHSNLEIETILL